MRPIESDHPAQDRYIRLLHLRDRFRTATFTAGQSPGLRRIPPPPKPPTHTKNNNTTPPPPPPPLTHTTLSIIILLNDFGAVKNIFDGNVNGGEQLSFPLNLASLYSEQMDVPESITVILNVMPQMVFWSMIFWWW